ncbi:MAG: DUF6455 family protein [Roseicyclus sp.]
MPGQKTLDQHEALVGRMATTLGVDLDDAELRGALPPDAREDMVLACTGCSNPGKCQRWLAVTQVAVEAPQYCRNRDRFSELLLP